MRGNKIIIGFLFLFVSMTYAQTDSSLSIQLPDQGGELSKNRKLKVIMGAEYSSNLQKKNDPDKSESMSFIFNPNFTFDNGAILDVRSDIVHDFQDQENQTYISDTAIVGATPKISLIDKKLFFTQMAGIVLPTNRQKYNDESYRGSVSLRPRLILSALKNVTITNTLYLNKNFHEFSIKNTAQENIEYTVRNRVGIDVQITSKLSLSLLNEYAQAWTYKGNRRESFLFAQEVALEMFKDTSIYVGHQNQGDVRGPGNAGTNMSAYDDRSSQVYGGASHIF